MPTTLQIKSAKPTDHAYKLADTGGRFVLVQSKGSKVWRHKFRLDGVEGLQALGAFPEVTLADARHAHAESRKLVAKGVHPVQARRDERESRAQAELHRVKGSFGAVCADWNAATGADLRPATVLQRNRQIEKDLTPLFKDRPISKITRLELTTALKEVEARAPEVARNLRTCLWGIFEYAIDSGLIADNPVPPVRVLRKRNQENHPALSPDLLGVFLRKLDAIDTIHEQTRIAMLLVVLTACRKAEVTGGKWSEIDLKAAEWEIPADRMKAGRAHWVPLSRQCVKLLQELRALVPEGSVYLFPNRLDPDRPMADRSLNALMERLGFSGDGTPHGMRATFSTHFNAIGAGVDVIEHCLAHVPGNRVRAAYNRHAYQAERRDLLQTWADHVDRLRTGVRLTSLDCGCAQAPHRGAHLKPPGTDPLEFRQNSSHTSDSQGMNVSNLAQQVLAHAASMPEGASLSAKALLHLGSRAAVDQALSRLARSGELLRAGRGVYVLPVKGKFGARAPEVAKVVQEWASQRGETVVGNGAAAANALGLTTQVPVRQVFLTSGRSRKLKLGAQTVELKHAPPWQLLYPGQAAGEAIRSLAWVGPSGSQAALGQLRQRLPASELLAVANARARLPTWLASQVSSLVTRV